MTLSTKTIPLIVLLIVAGLYSPGISGPFLFDDQSSITDNTAVAITELNLNNLVSVAESGIAGPLKRPIPMISFALNHYFAGGYKAAAFKKTNIAIHCVNTLLVFVLALQLLKLAFLTKKNLCWFAAAIALLWGAHPINLTSVLYIVQRMTSLSTLFSLGCIISYLYARQQTIISGLTFKAIAIFICSLCSLITALYSKENAIIIPITLLAAELTFFTTYTPWKYYSSLAKLSKIVLWVVIAFSFALFLNYAIGYASGGFSSRPFTMLERVLTESRVVSSYISLIFIPRINEFGLFHDDIALSTGILTPWTTLSSLIFLGVLIAISLIYRKKHPLFAFGIAWFFIGHLLESTFFPLEIAHEHRNNFPSIGLIIAAVSLFSSLNVSPKKAAISILSASLVLSSITFLRSTQWSNEYDQAYFETVHHPKSPAAHSIYSYAAFNQGLIPEALAALKTSTQLNPNEAGYFIFYQHALTVSQQKISDSLQENTLTALKNGTTSPTTINALEQMADCLETIPCKPLISNFLEWVEVMINKHPSNYLYYYFKGKSLLAKGDSRLALEIFQQGSRLNRGKLHLLLEMANIFIRHHDIDNLSKTIELFKAANKIAATPKVDVLTQLENSLTTIKKLRADAHKTKAVKTEPAKR